MSDRTVSVSRVIAAPPEKIFEVLATPSGHAVIDGSGTVKGEQTGPDRLTKVGDRFGMKMKMYGVPYKMSSNVVEFEENRLIAWAHFGGHRWRYELEPVDDGTRVTETFDWSTAKAPKFIELMGYPKKHPAAMEKTLERLDEHVTA
jgi:uncharacterized protein YndB with AHSA1/START domain